MDAGTNGPGIANALHRRERTARAAYCETRTLWWPEEWAAYVAYGEDPESPDYPVAVCDEELRTLRLEGFDTVTCGNGRCFGEYRGIAADLREYTALRIGGETPVTRRVTLAEKRVRLPEGTTVARILLDTRVRLTRTESQPVERLVAQAIRAACGEERRVARSWSGTEARGLERAWVHVEIDGPMLVVPPTRWRDQAAIKAGVDPRNCIAQVCAKAPGEPASGPVLPFYDHAGVERCPRCDAPKRTVFGARPSFCPRCDA